MATPIPMRIPASRLARERQRLLLPEYLCAVRGRVSSENLQQGRNSR